MEKQKIIIGILVAIGAAMIAAISLTLSSNWLWWEMIPKDNEITFSVESGAAHSVLNTISGAKNNVESLASAAAFINTSKKIAFAKKGNSQTLVVVSNWADISKNESSLLQEGWQFSKKANIFFAHRSENDDVLPANEQMSNVFAASLRMWVVILSEKQPVQPIAIASIKEHQLPGLAKSMGLVAQHYKKGILVVIDAADAGLAPLEPKQANETKDIINLFSDSRDILALPKELLSLIPPSEKKVLYSKVVEQAGLGKVTKQVLSEMDTLDSMVIVRASDAAVIGTSQNGSTFVKAIKRHIETQDGYNYPQRRAFKLPDGTLGYEYRPAAANKNWIHTSPECEYYEGKEQTWWACISGNRGAIGNTESETRDAVRNRAGWLWYLKVAQIKQLLPLKNITAALIGNSNRALLYLK